MSTAANKKLVQQVFTDSANRSGTTFADNLAEDAIWVVTGQYSWSHEFRGREAIQNGLMGHFRSFFAERPRTVAFNFIADGDYVAVEARGDNVTKAGMRYDNQYCLVFRIENGKIREIKEYCELHAGRARARAISGDAQAGRGPRPLSRVCADDPLRYRLKSRKASKSTFAIVGSILTMAMTIASAWRERSRARRQLAALSDREWQDIGACWSEISAEAGKPFWRK